MKRIVLFFIIFTAYNARAQQIFFPFYYDPFANYWITDSLNFEDPSSIELVIQDTHWQIGTPQKVFFDQAWSEPKVIVTDTTGPYSAYFDGSFYFKINPLQMTNLFISFNHKADLGPGDFCVLDLSVNGTTWYGLEDFCNYYITWGIMTVGETDLNTNISDFQYYFDQPEGLYYTDTTFNWMQTSIWLQWIFPLKDNAALFTDSLFVRFRFVSDANEQNQEGWMIDNIYIGEFFVGGTINENFVNKYMILSPNPSEGIFTFQSRNIQYPVSVTMCDLSGKTLFSETVHSNTLNVSQFQNGLYLLKFTDSSGMQSYSKIQISK